MKALMHSFSARSENRTNGTANYVLIERNNIGRPMKTWTSASGELWLLVGTDSGFEGTTSLYYTKIIVQLEVVTNPVRIAREGQTIVLEWNTGVLQAAATPIGDWADLPNATSPWREDTTTEPRKFWRVRAN